MLYVVRDSVNDIVAICDDASKVDKLREFAPETAVHNVEEVSTPYPNVEDTVYVFHDDYGNVLHYSPNALDVRNYIRGATSADQFSGQPEMRFKKESEFYGLNGYEINDLLRKRLDDGFMPNDFSADLDGVTISNYKTNYCYIGRDTNLRDDYLYGRSIDLAYEGLVQRKPTGYFNGMEFDLVFNKDITDTDYLSPGLNDWTIKDANGDFHTFSFGTSFWDQFEPNRLHVEVVNIEAVEGHIPTHEVLNQGEFTEFTFYFGENPAEDIYIDKVENMVCEFSNGHCAEYANLEKSATKAQHMWEPIKSVTFTATHGDGIGAHFPTEFDLHFQINKSTHLYSYRRLRCNVTDVAYGDDGTMTYTAAIDQKQSDHFQPYQFDDSSFVGARDTNGYGLAWNSVDNIVFQTAHEKWDYPNHENLEEKMEILNEFKYYIAFDNQNSVLAICDSKEMVEKLKKCIGDELASVHEKTDYETKEFHPGKDYYAVTVLGHNVLANDPPIYADHRDAWTCCAACRDGATISILPINHYFSEGERNSRYVFNNPRAIKGLAIDDLYLSISKKAEETKMPVPNVAYKENNELISAQLAANSSILQMDKDAQKTLHAPVILHSPYKRDENGEIATNKDGKKIIDFNAQLKPWTADSKNFLAAAEFMNSIGSKNPHFIPVKLAESNWNLQVKEDAKIFKMVMPYKDKEGKQQLREVECYNMAQVIPSKAAFKENHNVIPAVEVTNHRADLFLRDMVGYGHARLEKGTFKTDRLPLMIVNMVEAAKKNQLDRKPFYDKEDARLKAVQDTDLTATPGKNDLRGKFMQLMKEHYQENNKNYTIMAVKDAITQKWPKEAIKTCINELAPQAVYDDWHKASPYAKFAMDAAEKNIKAEAKKDKSAAR